MKKVPNPNGAPIKYKPELCDVIIQVAKDMGFKSAMCVAIGKIVNDNERPISSSTFNEWRERYPEFEDAWQQCNTILQANLENVALQGAVGNIKNFNLGALALIVNNKFPEEYKRTHNGAATEPANTTINILQMSPEEIKYKIAQKQEYLMQKGQLPQLGNIITINNEESS